MDKTIVIDYQEYDSIDELPREDSALMQKAIGAIEGSYAPYSGCSAAVEERYCS